MAAKADAGDDAPAGDDGADLLPPKCNLCHSLGHVASTCALHKPPKPAVAVYVQKPKHVATPASVPIVEPVHEPLEDEAIMESNIKINEKDHQIAVRELALNSRLQFLGLLETRVTLPNAARVQNRILPRWKWFSDYNSAGNCIWLAWDDDFLDIAILDIGVQFVHCRIFIRSSHINILVTVSYGANDVGSRRELWQALCNISDSIGDEPWLVGGDFNAVRDLSEVCGTSGDIRLAMNEFNDCILNTGLIAQPMRGERFTWHNCSDDDRSLWKRLDRLLANDKWMERWPDVFYDCLTPRTSDHSPLVLCGDCRRPQLPGSLSLKADLSAAKKDERGPLGKCQTGRGIFGSTKRLLQEDRNDPLLLHLEHCCRLVFLKAVKIKQGYGFTILAALGKTHNHGRRGQFFNSSITKDDVKTAVFDIEEDRAPGPDGYSSGFFKAA
ncbi:UNVERIFIED_CONTAM: hypothetical protein Sangu_2797300 [Sesamum angustifolium]|uniref:Endonuclease/exonuclease/phosphatase domain-containing protein n=1 Tax=Sesamum angustifolium TaxID=2727405 RepID=A0AAW2IT93_9LAMI